MHPYRERENNFTKPLCKDVMSHLDLERLPLFQAKKSDFMLLSFLLLFHFLALCSYTVSGFKP